MNVRCFSPMHYVFIGHAMSREGASERSLFDASSFGLLVLDTSFPFFHDLLPPGGFFTSFRDPGTEGETRWFVIMSSLSSSIL